MNDTKALILDRILQDFPGLVDGSTEVNGADLVDYITTMVDIYYPKSN